MADGSGFTIFEPPKPLVPITAAELLQMDIPPRQTLLAPWLPAKGAAMIYAPRGLGKTYLSLSIAVAVAGGGSVLGWKAGKPSRVLFFDGEMPLGDLQERVTGIINGADGNPTEDGFFRFLPADHYRDGLPKLTSPEGLALIKVETEGTDLMIFDNLSSLAAGRENEADDWQATQDMILFLRRRGVSVLLIHHAGKSGQQRGTSRREDVLDTVIALKRPDDYDPSEGARFEVHFEKCRGFTGADAAPFEARLTTEEAGAYRWITTDLHKDGKAEAFEMFATGRKAEDVAHALDIDRSTAFRWRKEYRNGCGA